MKRFVTITVALLLLMMSSAVALTDAQRADLTARLPEEVTLRSEETDDGMLEVEFASADGMREYEFTLAADGTVIKLAFDLLNDRGGASPKLTDDEVKALLLKDFPDATVTSITPEIDDGFHEIDVSFTTPELSGKYTLNAETGAVLDYTLYYTLPGVAGGADAASIIAAAYPGAVVTKVELDTDDGVQQYEGEATYQNRVYEFEINAQTLAITKWELD